MNESKNPGSTRCKTLLQLCVFQYSRTSLFRTRIIRSPRYFEGRSNALGFTLPLYASPVISKPRYFELFFHFPWDFEIAGFDCIIILPSVPSFCPLCPQRLSPTTHWLSEKLSTFNEKCTNFLLVLRKILRKAGEWSFKLTLNLFSNVVWVKSTTNSQGPSMQLSSVNLQTSYLF